jgi:predicted Zn-dependent peptidase
MPVISLFNTYYPNIVFQEIREAQGLAYSAYGWINIPSKKDRSCFTQSFVATQSDKLREGTSSVISLMNNFKEDKIQFDLAKESIRKSIDAERITKTDIFWTYLNNYDRGISGDNRKEIYDKVPKITFADVKQFVDKQKSGNYTLLVIGKKGMVDENVLRKLGNYKEMSLKEVFNY